MPIKISIRIVNDIMIKIETLFSKTKRRVHSYKYRELRLIAALAILTKEMQETNQIRPGHQRPRKERNHGKDLHERWRLGPTNRSLRKLS